MEQKRYHVFYLHRVAGDPKFKEKLPNTPIVLHGASSVIPRLVEMCNENGGNIPGAKGCPNEMLKQAGENGVSKINVHK